MPSRREFIKTAAASGLAIRSSFSWIPSPTLGYPVIDAHGHLGDLANFAPNLKTTPAELATVCKRHGISRMIISNTTALYFDAETGNAETLQAARDYPEHLMAAVSFPSPYVSGILQYLERYAAQGARVLGEIKFDSVGSGAAIPLLKKAAELGMVVLAHTDPAAAAAAASAVPNARLLLAHLGTGNPKSPFDWRRGIEAAQQHKNIYLETCTSVVDRGMIEEAVKALGPERLVFGTDFPLLDVRVMMAKIFDARISDEARRLIFGGNMMRLLESTK